jgi:hypothetical protein
MSANLSFEEFVLQNRALKVPRFGAVELLSDPSPEVLLFFWDLMRGISSPLPACSVSSWNRVFELFDQWSIPMLFWKAHTLSRGHTPPKEIMDRMRLHFLSSRARTRVVQQQLGEIAAAFDSKDIPFLAWKGSALAFTVYPDPAMRPGQDIDLLVRPADFLKVRSAMEGLGYRSIGRWFEAVPEYGNTETFVDQRGPGRHLPIDIHWKVHPYEGARGVLGEADLFRRSVRHESSPADFRVLHPVDALVILALHMVLRHPHEFQLIWVEDASLLARSFRVPQDWRDLQEQAVGWQARLAVERTLRIASLWTDLRLPDGFDDFTRWPEPSKEEKEAFHHGLRSRERKLSLFRLYWPRHASISEKAAFLFRVLFPGPEYVRWKCPPRAPYLLPISYVRCWAARGGSPHPKGACLKREKQPP